MFARLVVLPSLLLALAACPRPVATETTRSATAPPPVITGLQVEPDRGTSTTLDGGLVRRAFGDDVLVVTGTDLGGAASRVLLGTRALELAEGEPPSAARLRLRLPRERVVAGITVVVQGLPEARHADLVGIVGQGHPASPRESGTVEPAVSIISAGTEASACKPPLPVGLPDGGMRVDFGRPCNDVNSTAGHLAVAFTLGPFPSADSEVYVADLAFLGGNGRLVQLDGLASGEALAAAAGATGAPESRFVVATRPYQPGGERSPLSMATFEYFQFDGTRGTVGAGRWSVDGVSVLDNALPFASVVGGRVLVMRPGTSDAHEVVELRNVDGGPPAVSVVATPSGHPVAAGAVEKGYDPFLDALSGQPQMVDVACSDTGTVFIHRVMADGTLMTATQPPPRADCGGSPDCAALTACGEDCLFLDFCAAHPGCRSQLDNLVACNGNVACRTPLTAFFTCIAACPNFEGPDGGPCMEPACTVAQQCTPGGTPDCYEAALCAGFTCGIPPRCLTGTGCPELACALDDQCASDARCARDSRGGGECDGTRRCLEHACTAGEAQRVLPLTPGVLSLAREHSTYRVNDDGAPMCAVLLYGRGQLVELMPLAATASTTVPVPGSEHHRMALVPAAAGNANARQLFIQDYGTGLFRRSETRVAYASLHGDALNPLIYAVPATGGRVDILDENGTYNGSVHVLGYPVGVHPDADGRTLVLHGDSLLIMDAQDVRRFTLADAEAVAPRWLRSPYELPVQAWGPWDNGGPGLVLADISDTESFGTLTDIPLTVAGGATVTFMAPVIAMGPDHVAAYAVRDDNTAFLGVVDAQTATLAPYDTSITDNVQLVPVAADGTGGRLLVLRIIHAEGEDVVADLLVGGRSGGALQPVPPAIDDHGMVPRAATAHPRGDFMGVVTDTVDLFTFIATLDTAGTMRCVAGAPLLPLSMLASPDGRRLYLGSTGSIVEMEVAEVGSAETVAGCQGETLPAGALHTRLLRTIPIQGQADRLATDEQGLRILYVDFERQFIGEVR